MRKTKPRRGAPVGNEHAAKVPGARRIPKQFSMYPDTLERLARLAEKTGETNSELVARALKLLENQLLSNT